MRVRVGVGLGLGSRLGLGLGLGLAALQGGHPGTLCRLGGSGEVGEARVGARVSAGEAVRGLVTHTVTA